MTVFDDYVYLVSYGVREVRPYLMYMLSESVAFQSTEV